MIRSMQSVPAIPAPGTGKNAGKNKKKRANKKKRVAKAAGTMTSQLGAGRATVPQTCKIDIDQVANHAGGFVWKLSDLEHAKRYLIMGAKDNGNFYQTTEQVSTECHTSILRIIRMGDFKKLCDMLKEISVRGLAARQEPTLLSLAAAIVFAPSAEKKAMALALVPECVRIPTHAFMLSGYVTDLSQCKPGKEKGKGWGSGFRKALSQFYTSRRGLELATAVTKYKNREGWRQEDLLRMLHINPATLKDFGAQLVFKYVFACARGEKDFIRKLLTDIAAAKTHERAMQLLETPIPVSQKPTKAVAAKAPNPAIPAKDSKKGVVAGFKAVIQSVFGSAEAPAPAPAPVEAKKQIRKTQIKFQATAPTATAPTAQEDAETTKVEIATSAFGWKRMFMHRSAATGGFSISLELPIGTHDFKFIVNGVWQCDPSKPTHKTGDHENNFIVITEEDLQQPAEKQEQSPPPRGLIDVAVYLSAIMEMEACTTSVSDLYKAIKLVRDHGLVREQIPTHLLNSSDIWKELLNSKGANGKQTGMPLEAMTRNLGKFSSLPNFMGQENTNTICVRLSSEEDIQRSRIHPFKVLVASRIYGMGKALKGALSWTVSPRVRDQLTTTFLRSFKNVPPTGKRYMAALDVSGSMSAMCMGSPAISCREASAALALVLYETEHNGNGHVYLRGFTAAQVPGAGFYNFDPYVRHGMTLEQFITATNSPFGATDCSLPMLRAIQENLDVDVFIVMTDSETYAGSVHPQVALENYRMHANKPNAKLIVVGMTANCLTIADPNDRNTLNLAGFDASMPEIIAMFVRGEL